MILNWCRLINRGFSVHTLCFVLVKVTQGQKESCTTTQKHKRLVFLNITSKSTEADEVMLV